MASEPGAPDASEPARTWPATFRLLVRNADLEHPTLSHREREILALAVTGSANREIAARLYLTESTVKTHLSWAFRRLGVHSRREAALVLAWDDVLRREVLAALERSHAPIGPEER
jgi:DNA-binding CsgD family transcriptional regulator